MVERHPEIKIFGEACLRETAEKVSILDNAFHELVEKMKRVMHEADGIGIAANQIGSNLAVFITRANGVDEVIINPEIVEKSDIIESFTEGCLSVPGPLCNSHKTRYNKIKVRYSIPANINEIIEKELSGIPAVVFQHETDHLNGKLYIDHYGPVSRSMALDKHNKYMKKLNRSEV